MNLHDLNLTDDEKWMLIYGSLAGGYKALGGDGYKEIVKWMSAYDSLDEAVEAAMRYRDGMIAT